MVVQPPRLVLVLAGLLLLGSGACRSDVPPDPSPDPVQDASALNLTLRVEGMT